MKARRLMIAAPGSGCGKTLVTCALLQALKEMGKNAAAYKCGPDYIDPLFHQKVLGVPSKNLDTFFTGEKQTKALFAATEAARGGDTVVVMEGVMGLYDGLGGVREEGSSYHLAKVTGTPVVLVINARGMGKSLLALIAGFLAYDTEHLIKGVILNRISKSYYGIIKPLIEKECNIRVLGYLPEDGRFRWESRHLGLVLPDELPGLREQLSALSRKFQETVSVPELMKIADEAENWNLSSESENITKEKMQPGYEGADGIGASVECMNGAVKKRGKNAPVIGVAMDEAFCFYYEDNLRLLEKWGAKLVPFSPLRDKKLPEDCQGLLLGGGYPEVYAEQLSANREMREAVRRAWESRMPMVAECGGFMYLHSALELDEGRRQEMAGALPGECRYTGKLVRFGYVEIEDKKGYFLPAGKKIRGHEFHYFDSTDNGGDCVAVKPFSGRKYDCIMTGETYWLGFPHLYYPSNPAFAENFVKKVVHRSEVNR